MQHSEAPASQRQTYLLVELESGPAMNDQSRAISIELSPISTNHSAMVP